MNVERSRLKLKLYLNNILDFSEIFSLNKLYNMIFFSRFIK